MYLNRLQQDGKKQYKAYKITVTNKTLSGNWNVYVMRL